ncbi:MAG TPA: nucleotidyltransferase family protein, partial [Rhodocyclaceae bacterium]|nr:nucleotidyltransferase family protein [Rhodocyclaceae bacterium]
LPPLVGPGGIALELHHRLTPPDLPHFRRFEERLWSRRIGKAVGGMEVQFPRAEDMLLHLCIHATLDHQLDVGPLALMDITTLVETESLDWDDFLRCVGEGHWGRCVLPPLFLAERHFGAKIPQTVIDALGVGEGPGDWVGDAEYLLFSDSRDHKVLDYGVQEMLYSPKRSERLARLVGAAFPPRTVIARHFPVRSDSVLAYLYYPLRWYRLATGKLPELLRAHSGGAVSLRQLAIRRAAFLKWLNGEHSTTEHR